MRALITGGDGMLGRALARVAGDAPDVEALALARGELDVADPASVAAALERHRPDVVCNAAAYTDVDGAEADPQAAWRANADGPAVLAEACASAGARLVTVSTDYVFDGRAPRDADGRPRGYAEDDPTAPVSAYGRSKAAGEERVRAALADHVIVRTAWLQGDGPCFVRTIARAAAERDELRVVDDQIGSPTFAVDLARALLVAAREAPAGTYHRTGEGSASWHELAVAVVDRLGLATPVVAIPSSELQRAATRPAWSVLAHPAADAAGLAPLPHWRESLPRLLDAAASG